MGIESDKKLKRHTTKNIMHAAVRWPLEKSCKF